MKYLYLHLTGLTIMDETAAILEQAKKRAQEAGLPYSGAVTPAEAHTLLQSVHNIKLVDVRSKAELDWVGRIPGAIEIELRTYPGMQPNQQFMSQLTSQVSTDSTVLFICRSGARSNFAAQMATQANYTNCYNVLEGFEGDPDESGHRGSVAGWKFAGLPWVQG